MLHLTPLEQTVAVQELIQQGIQTGIQKGELIGKIRMAQCILQRPESSQEELTSHSLEALQRMLDQLQRELHLI